MTACLWQALSISPKSGGFLWAHSPLDFCGSEQRIDAMNNQKKETK
jgi:hypothetical protein